MCLPRGSIISARDVNSVNHLCYSARLHFINDARHAFESYTTYSTYPKREQTSPKNCWLPYAFSWVITKSLPNFCITSACFTFVWVCRANFLRIFQDRLTTFEKMTPARTADSFSKKQSASFHSYSEGQRKRRDHHAEGGRCAHDLSEGGGKPYKHLTGWELLVDSRSGEILSIFK